ncbi:MAG: TIGR01244 family sulfur transferase [Neomegalonema sp.]|nr:TIGR01244 family sulfur transferase [Neomegalonema sp.]
MAQFRQVTPTYFVSGQLAPADIAKAAEAGVKTLVINRPDGEAPGQPSHKAMMKAAEEAGMQAFYIPVVNGRFEVELVDALKEALAGSSAPVLAYCAGGMRSTALWALAQAGTLPADTILSAAGDAGFDLSALRGHLE